jgi:long-chain fatty acid transport protein
MCSLANPTAARDFFKTLRFLFSKGRLLLLAGALLSPTARLHAEGFRNPPPGAFSLGRAGGRIAHIEDVSAISHNPANLTFIQSPGLSLTPTFVYIRAEYESPQGHRASTIKPWKFLPNLFVAAPFAENRWAAGFGITTPYGLSHEWKQDGAFADPSHWRYQAPYFTQLQTLNFTPALATRLGPLRFGAALDAYWAELSVRQFYPWFLFGGSEGVAQFKGDGFGFGGRAGITWELTQRQRVALTYRSPATIDYTGHFRISNIPETAPPGIQPSSRFESKITFPTILAAGYGLEITDHIRLEVNVEWLEFSKFDHLPLDLGNNPVPLIPSSIPQNWKNTFTAGLGGDWRFAPGWSLRASYQFYESPVPDRTFSPTIPDANQHVFTTGVGYQSKNHGFEFAYGGIFYDDRNISGNINPAFDGAYNITVHLFALAYNYSF